MKVLYIGGSGQISTACVAESVSQGHTVSVFNRGTTASQSDPRITYIHGDIRDPAGYAPLQNQQFDVVCQFVAYEPADIRRDIELFSGHCGQYIFISSASGYHKPIPKGLITEATPMINPFWAYSRAKAASEETLIAEAVDLPFTIIRPSHTVSHRFPSICIDGDHLAWRLLNNKPVLIHDNGELLWTMTFADDFAIAFNRVFGEAEAIGQTYHITDDTAYTWNHLIGAVSEALDTVVQPCFVATQQLVDYEPAWEGTLLGDKAYSVQFDNSKIRGLIGDWHCQISLQTGLSRIAATTLKKMQGYQPNPETDQLVDRIIREQGA
ncbi:MAG: NAD-dependent epimerase/dehydratase family protein [Pseudomonadota bacterium]